MATEQDVLGVSGIDEKRLEIRDVENGDRGGRFASREIQDCQPGQEAEEDKTRLPLTTLALSQ